MKVTVVGAGSWGTAVAAMVAAKTDVTLWVRRDELAAAIARTHENADYLPGLPLPDTLHPTTDLDTAVSGADVVVMGVPSHGYREILRRAAPAIDPSAAVVSLTKGIEQSTLMRMTEVTAEVLSGHDRSRIGVLTGPNLAKEVMTAQPAASVVAFESAETADRLQELFMAPTFRVYTNDDVIGCEAAGALKNVMAIAAGMAAGLGFGNNTLAALITRALAELTRLGVELGGKPLTFAGLAGMGDLIATCMSSQSRNHRVGFALGRGRSLEDIIAEMNMVAEGVKTTRSVMELAARHGVEMPIAAQVGAVLYDGADPKDAVANLMLRQARRELHGIE